MKPRQGAQATLLSLNAYLLPSLLVSSANASCANQAERAAAIGKFASQFDICSMQEVWGSNTGLIESNLSTHHTSYKSWGYTVLDTVWFGGYGGLYNAWRRGSWALVKQRRLTFNASRSRSRKGAHALLLGSGQALVCLINTHLDPEVAGHRIREQLHELRGFMRDTLHEWQLPESAAVLLCGDLNCGHAGQLFREHVMALDEGARDLHGEQPHPPPNTYDPGNPYVVWPEDAGCLDHFIAFDSFQKRRYARVSAEHLTVHSQVILSDHYPISVTLKW